MFQVNNSITFTLWNFLCKTVFSSYLQFATPKSLYELSKV